jgi:hypothetical protein
MVLVVIMTELELIGDGGEYNVEDATISVLELEGTELDEATLDVVDVDASEPGALEEDGIVKVDDGALEVETGEMVTVVMMDAIVVVWPALVFVYNDVM